MNVNRIRLAGLGALAAFGLCAGAAQAAPQALALVATGGDVPLTCQDGECKAEMSAFCLQHDRQTPVRGTVYNLVDGSDLVLKGRTADGRELVLNAAEHLDFASERTHVAMRVSIPEAEMRALGVTQLTINAGENVALLPEPKAGDANPHDEADLLVLAGPLRMLGAKMVDRNQKHMLAARVANRMINDIADGDRLSPAEGERLFQATVQGLEGQQLPGAAIEMARRSVDFCQFVVENKSRSGGIRQCLQEEHDDLLKVLNSNYWTAVKTGS